MLHLLKQIKTIRHIAPALMVFLTRKDRYLPEIDWSDKSWTHNIFRFYELVFWRRKGLRIETSVYPVFDEYGRILREEIYCHTFESLVANTETLIREWLSAVRMPKITRVKFDLSFLDVLFGDSLCSLIPALATANGFIPSTKDFNYLFAIAVDATANGGTGYSHTCTGSNRGLMLATGYRETDTNGDTATYNSVSMPYVIGDRSTNNGGDGCKLYKQIAPATGANTVAFTYANGSGQVGGSVSFSGADQITLTGATTNGFPTSNGASYSITTTRANSYTVESQWGQTTSAYSQDQGQTQWGGSTISSQRYGNHAYKAHTTVGSKSLGFGSGNTQVWGYATAEVLEFVASGPANLKSRSGNLKANIKTNSGNLLANMKSLAGNS